MPVRAALITILQKPPLDLSLTAFPLQQYIYIFIRCLERLGEQQQNSSRGAGLCELNRDG